MSLLSAYIAKQVKKHGLKGIIIKVGDLAVKATKSKKDDKVWAEAKKVLNKL
jgi:hypothetical protein|tara:strand:- start:156 stop:311 length:156 start_codon:yes stop_codon:yes gene_type:complete